MRGVLLTIAAAAGCALSVAAGGGAEQPSPRPSPAPAPAIFQTSDRCQACHNGLSISSGQDVSIGIDWRASMMAHSVPDPYWQAAVRREVLDHPVAGEEIEHECSRCHMPMAHVAQVAAGAKGRVFANLPLPLAADGVSCTVCHQIRPDRLGTPASFTGHFVVDTTSPAAGRPAFGPFAVDAGRVRIMQSAVDFVPTEAAHVRSSEMCATCHTLYTSALDDAGHAIGTLPEQVPYLEWRHSALRETQSCQACHMPLVPEPVPVSSTMGDPRSGVRRHTFRGSNSWMLRVLNRYRAELGVSAPGRELALAAEDSDVHLQQDAATIAVERLARVGGRLRFDVAVANRTGHKLPTAYPSRRAWIHLVVRNAAGVAVFESGAVAADGSIAGNDNDANAGAFEPHHQVIGSADQVQIYEDIMHDRAGAVTTGLLSGVRYVKDNRLLPQGFDKTTAPEDVAVHGDAASDADFTGGGDTVLYDIAVGDGPLTVEAELLFQTVGFRWAHNLRARPAPETDRFVRYYESMAGSGVQRLARATAHIP